MFVLKFLNWYYGTGDVRGLLGAKKWRKWEWWVDDGGGINTAARHALTAATTEVIFVFHTLFRERHFTTSLHDMASP